MVSFSQQHYVCELLISTNMQDANSVSHPPKCLYLTLLDVSFSVSKLSQYMQAPIEIHMKVVKCLLCYLKGTLDHDLHLSRFTDLCLTIFCDSYWAGDTHDRKSTVVYLIYGAQCHLLVL